MNKKIALATAALSILLTGAASAADLAARPYTKAPPPVVAVYNWTGFYVGGHAGGSWTNQEWVNTFNTTAWGDLAPGQGYRNRETGFIGGGQIGYNWQANNFVFGLEGTISGLTTDSTVLNTVFGAGDDVFSWKSEWMATVTGRIGVAYVNNLFYVKGGWAGVNNKLSVVDNVPNPSTGSGSQTNWHNGWTVGAGWEYGLTQNWILGVEYNYAAFETKSYQLNNTQAGAVYTFDAKPRDIQSVVGRISYKFGGPVIARY